MSGKPTHYGAGQPSAQRGPAQPGAGKVSVDDLRRRRKRASPLRSLLAGIWRTTVIALALLILILSIAFFVGSTVLVKVLREVSSRDFNASMQRIGEYEECFEQLKAQGYHVEAARPKIVEGVTSYLWQVSPKQYTDPRVFEWKYDLEANEVTPQSGPAGMLDLKLGYVKQAQMDEWKLTVSNDPLLEKIIALQSYTPQVSADGSSWSGSALADPPPLPAPLIDPKGVNGRARIAPPTDPEEEAAKDAAAAIAGGAGTAIHVGEGEPGAGEDGDATPVEPPDDTGGGASDNGDGDNGGSEDDAPVEPPEDGGGDPSTPIE